MLACNAAAQAPSGSGASAMWTCPGLSTQPGSKLAPGEISTAIRSEEIPVDVSESDKARSDGQWASLASLGQEPHLSEAQKTPVPSVSGAEKVVGVGALCDYLRPPDTGESLELSVDEFIRLDNGNAIFIDHRGTSISPPIGKATLRYSSQRMNPQWITEVALNTVLPDDDAVTEEHPWEWLTQCAHAKGVSVTTEELRKLEYVVLLSDRLQDWLKQISAHS